MMKPLSKTTTQTHILLVALFIGVSMPTLSFAQEGTAPVRDVRANFCTKVDDATAKVTAQLGERETKYETRRTEGRGKVAERFGERDLTRTEKRSNWDGKREEWKTKLEERASTTEAKAAVETFMTTMDKAVATRRAAVDQAIKEFRAGVDAAIVARESAVAGHLSTLKQEIALAGEKAKSDCASGVDPKTARTTYVAALKSAKDKFRAGVKSVEARKDTLVPLANQRKLAIDSAVKTFKETVTKATYDLKKNVK
jgi:hypothetical protein